MKTTTLFIAVALVVSTLSFKSDNAKKLPSVALKNLTGGQVNSSDFKNNGKPIIISFWATWCAPCKKELDNIHEVYEKWQKETGVKLIAVSIDDARNSPKVATTVNGKGWNYEVYLDENQDFKRAMSVNTVPHTFLVDGNGNIVWEHNNYAEGDEDELFNKVKELISK